MHPQDGETPFHARAPGIAQSLVLTFAHRSQDVQVSCFLTLENGAPCKQIIVPILSHYTEHLGCGLLLWEMTL